MKYVKFEIPQHLLFNHWCRQLISNLYDLGTSGQGKILITHFSPDMKVVNDNNLPKLEIESNGENLIRILTESGALEILNSEIVDTRPTVKSLMSTMKIKNFEVLKRVVVVFADYMIEEQYGLEKQVRIVKEALQRKYIEYENYEVNLKSSYFSDADLLHMNLIKTLFYLESEGYISLDKTILNLRVQKQVWTSETEFHSEDEIYGAPFVNSHITIKQKLILEWIGPEFLRNQTVSFDPRLGELVVMDKIYSFCDPGSIEGDVMKLLVANLNERVEHQEIAKITWVISDPQRLVAKYKELGKSEVNRRNKENIIRLRQKIRKAKLNKLLQIVPCNGYKLSFKPNISLASERSIELVNKAQVKHSSDEDIPF